MLRKTLNWLKIKNNLPDYLLIGAALLIWWGAVVYYLFALNWLGIILTLILSAGSFYWLRRWLPDTPSPADKIIFDSVAENKNKNWWRLPAIYGLLFLSLIILLYTSRSTNALISPWQAVNINFFWVYALASVLLISIIASDQINNRLKISLISGHYFISFAVALIIYKIGYGFDPFVHQATMELIAAKGVVLPKPPYYLGEYGLIVILSKLSAIPIAVFNKLLVPGLAALFLPPAIYRFLLTLKAPAGTEIKEAPDDKRALLLTVLMALSLTFSPFILTTPQNLSYLFLILTLLAAFDRFSLPIIGLLALATAAIHPLTGLPALALVTWLMYKKYQNHFKPKAQKITALLIWLFTALSLPLALLLSGLNNIKNIGVSGAIMLTPVINIIGQPDIAGHEDWLANLLYLFAHNYNLLYLVIIGTVIIMLSRRPRWLASDYDLYRALLFLSSALFAAYLLSSQIVFNGLIAYEQNDYAARIMIIIAIFFLPAVLAGLKYLISQILKQDILTKIIWLAFGLGLLTASLYLSYPRLDKYENSRGYSTSASDITAVKLINKVAGGEPYIALADQQVSAAALQTFGFDHYYETSTGPQYFYPIPTGGPLYQYYLKMVYGRPDISALIGALNLTGVNRAYLIINKYWYESDRTINQAQLLAKKWWDVNDQVYVFEYSR